ncbi:hypothetical protein [Petrocella sp. FN5]|uniref:hypothetical protein n=1 Tax=Petrocella sp. FN5 TaxID=3032002 RepID=UPI0023DB258C|nr:hypothetical protein [Petrocella sp. FN5]MDF1617755.1 hypothetical protein [Petrocella sp. FN5]
MLEKPIYRYKAFGLNLYSEIKIPELNTSEGEEDVRIQLGRVPRDIKDVLEESDQYQLSRRAFAFDIEGVAKYYITDGKEIVVELYSEADLERVTVYLLGTAMGVLLIQRNRIALHGSAVSVGQKALIITGDCGAGKTSLCSAFRKNGYGFLADDISAIAMDSDHQPFVHPAFPQQRLCTDTALEMGYNLQSLKLASMEENKYIVKLEEDFIEEKRALAVIVEIQIGHLDEVVLEELRGIKKVKQIEKNIYCGPLYENIGFTNDYYQALLLMAKHVDYYSVFRPQKGFTVDEQLRQIISKLSGDDIG